MAQYLVRSVHIVRVWVACVRKRRLKGEGQGSEMHADNCVYLIKLQRITWVAYVKQIYSP